MKKKLVFVIAGAILVLFFLSCERVSKPTSPDYTTTVLDIPANYGSLIAVTTDTQFPGWGQLWFSDATGKITMMRINWVDRMMIKSPLTISRSQEPTSTEGMQ